MSSLQIHIKNVKNIKDFDLTIPLDQGLYAIAGTNGVGKSTLMSLLSIPFRVTVLNTFFTNAQDGASVYFMHDDKEETWVKNKNKWSTKGNREVRLDGFFEGSIIHGTRFSDANMSMLESAKGVDENLLVPADDFIQEYFSTILHGKKGVYPEIKKIKNRHLARNLGFESIPYFIEFDGNRLSQFSLSTGESMMISLLHFLVNKIHSQKRKGRSDRSLILIDEVELALHPTAITRLLKMLKEVSKEYNLAIFFSTHSTELLRQLSPENVFYLQKMSDGKIQIINPCYPAYATRALYSQDGYDFLYLVEDELAKYVIDKILKKEGLHKAKLNYILPCGDWRNTVRMHAEIIESNLASKETKVISILDGDVEEVYKNEKINHPEFEALNVTFLPIQSLEKYLYFNLIEAVNYDFWNEINDRFFTKTSLQELLLDFEKNYKNTNKKLWDFLLISVNREGWEKSAFIREICELIYERIDTAKLSNRFKKLHAR